MLSYHLKNALSDLKELIEMTESDIKDIKEVKHDSQFERMVLKEEKLKSFENNKALIDGAILSLMTMNPEKELTDLLNDEQHDMLADLKVELASLHEVNKRYAKFVLTVSNLYNTFLEKLVPTEMQGYNKVASKASKIIEVRV